VSVLGTMTRESWLVAPAAVVAALLKSEHDKRPGTMRRIIHDRSLLISAVALTVGGVTTYFTLRVVLARPGDHATFWQHILPAFNWHESSIIALLVAGAGVGAMFAVLPGSVISATRPRFRYGWATLFFWVLSMPYLVVSFVGGTWFEALRLVLPVAIGQYLLRWAADGRAGGRPGQEAPELMSDNRAAGSSSFGRERKPAGVVPAGQ